MTKLLLFPSLLLFSFFGFSQLPVSLISKIEQSSSFENYEGSVYKSMRFSSASSVIDEKSGSFDAKLRYNIHTDAVEFMKGDQLYEVVKNPTTHIRMDKDYYYYCLFKNQRGLKQHGYYILVELNENYRIYKKLSLHFIEPSPKASYLDKEQPGKIRHEVSYFIEERGVVMELPRNKKEILTVFADKKNELQGYIKAEKIKVRKEEDLIRLVAKYNALKINNDSYLRRSLLSNN